MFVLGKTLIKTLQIYNNKKILKKIEYTRYTFLTSTEHSMRSRRWLSREENARTCDDDNNTRCLAFSVTWLLVNT